MGGEPFVSNGKSSATLERIYIDGEPHIVKRWSYSSDWLAQANRDENGAAARLWASGLMDDLPECIDHATVSMEYAGDTTTVTMRDVGASLIPESESVIPVDQHRRLLTHMAAFHAHRWNWTDDIGLIALGDRYSMMTRQRVAEVMPASPEATVPPLILEGWARLVERAPAMADALFELHRDPTPLVAAVSTTPSSLLHGDWKFGNLGSHRDGRTVIVDWALPGAGPPCHELAHYVALNRSRMPGTKEEAIEIYRRGVEAEGIATAGWFDRQVQLCMLGIMVELGWEKALGDDDELRWWSANVEAGAALL